jgi:regulatory protein
LRWLKVKDRTEREIRSRLAERGAPDDVIDAVLEYLQSKKYVHDPRVAERAVELASSQRPAGREKVRAELEQRGADDEAIASALDALPAEAEADRALGLIQARFKPGDDPARVARWLATKGFDEDSCLAALTRFFPGLELH